MKFLAYSTAIVFVAMAVDFPTANAQPPLSLFNGESLEQWEFAEGGWMVDEDGSLTCRMDKVKQKNGTVKVRSKGYIWTKQDYDNFELTLSYKLSATANTGIFFRTDQTNPVQGGFEIQLLDNEGFQKLKGKKDPKNLNGALYDCQAASSDVQKAIGEWNQLKLTCKGSIVELQINGVAVNKADIDQWDTPNRNPDGSPNKFKTALNNLPANGKIGLQNHGNVVWFKDITIRPL